MLKKLKEKVEKFLKDYGINLNFFKGKPAVNLLTTSMSPYYSLYPELSYQQNDLSDTEVYYRSGEHPLNHGKGKQKLAGYGNFGTQSHLGFYRNPIEHVERIGGKAITVSKTAAATTPGDGKLQRQFLNYQHMAIKEVLALTAKLKTQQIKVGMYNEYPCLMVNLKRPTVYDKGEASDATQEAWAELWSCFLVGLVNHLAFEQGFAIEMVRRSSFGFLKPTVAITGDSIRINIGMVPTHYVKILPVALAIMEKAIKNVMEKADSYPVSEDLFVHQAAYKKYVNESKRPIFKAKNLVNLLLAKAEKGRSGGRTVRTMLRTSYARQKLTASFMKLLDQDTKKSAPETLFMNAVTESLKDIHVEKGTLSMRQGQAPKLSLPTMKVPNETNFIINQEFVSFFEELNARVKSTFNDSPRVRLQADIITKNIKERNFKELYKNIEILQELMYLDAVEHDSNTLDHDGYGSDSDYEGDIKSNGISIKINSKKLITQNGMRAIFVSLTAIARYRQREVDGAITRCHLKTAYYQTALGLKKYQNQYGLNTQESTLNNANVVIFDANACVTVPGLTTTTWKQVLAAKKPYLILDVTSTTDDKVNAMVKEMLDKNHGIKAIFLVSSGLKYEQLGSDKNLYGTIRIVTKNKGLTNELYNIIKRDKIEAPTQSVVAHYYRRLQKMLGNVATTKEYLKNRPTASLKTPPP